MKKNLYVVLFISAAVLITLTIAVSQYLQIENEQRINHYARIETNIGNITLHLYENVAPQATERFKRLSEDGYYDDSIIHRIIDDTVIYGGAYDPNGEIIDCPYDPIAVETDPSFKHISGTISYLRTHVDQLKVGCQFLICVDNLTQLDGQNTAFGMVVDGFDLVRKTSRYPHDNQYGDGSGRPMNPFDVWINNITILTPEEYQQYQLEQQKLE